MSALSELLNQANAEGLTLAQITDRMRSLGHEISRDTVWRHLKGTNPTIRREYLAAFVDVFPSLSIEQLERAGAIPADLGDWTPPEEARVLTIQERDALVVLIKSMAAGKMPSNVTSLQRLAAAEPHQEVPEAAMEEPRHGRPRHTPPGASEEPYTER